MYANVNTTFVKQLVLRSYEKTGDNKHCTDDITLEVKQYVDHKTYTYTNGEDSLTVRIYYSARITISGFLNGCAITEALF